MQTGVDWGPQTACQASGHPAVTAPACSRRLQTAVHALAACPPMHYSWQHEEAMAASLAPGVADLLQGHLCGLGCMHEAPENEVTQVGGQATASRRVLVSRHTACEPPPSDCPAGNASCTCRQSSALASWLPALLSRPPSPAPPPHPLQAEYAAAVRETYQLLQGAVTAINEALEEVQQAQADLLEQ